MQTFFHLDGSIVAVCGRRIGGVDSGDADFFRFEIHGELTNFGDFLDAASDDPRDEDRNVKLNLEQKIYGKNCHSRWLCCQ